MYGENGPRLVTKIFVLEDSLPTGLSLPDPVIETNNRLDFLGRTGAQLRFKYTYSNTGLPDGLLDDIDNLTGPPSQNPTLERNPPPAFFFFTENYWSILDANDTDAADASWPYLSKFDYNSDNPIPGRVTREPDGLPSSKDYIVDNRLGLIETGEADAVTFDLSVIASKVNLPAGSRLEADGALIPGSEISFITDRGKIRKYLIFGIAPKGANRGQFQPPSTTRVSCTPLAIALPMH